MEEPRQPEQPEPPRSNEVNCDEHNQNCERLNCQYDIDTSYNDDGCRVCTCSHPCKDHQCPEGSVCAVDYEFDPESGTNFVPVCRQQQKAGECPRLANSTTCSRDCYDDSDCRGDKKCCEAGCGFVCVDPASEHVAPTARPEVHNYPGAHSPVLEERAPEEVNVNSAEGGHAVLRCFATGYPPPTVTWHRHGITLNTDQGRYGITTDGDLQIVQLHRTDSGIYVCIADNGLGQVTREVALEVAGEYSFHCVCILVWYSRVDSMQDLPNPFDLCGTVALSLTPFGVLVSFPTSVVLACVVRRSRACGCVHCGTLE